jgi:hypothetical protein
VLRDVFGEIVIDDPDVPPNYSVSFGHERGVGTPLMVVFRRYSPVIRSRSPKQILLGLARLLSEHQPLSGASTLRFSGLLAATGTSAVLLPRQLHQLRQRMEPRLRRGPVRFLDSLHVDLDAEGNALVPADPLGVTTDRVSEAAVRWPEPSRQHEAVAPGAYKLVRWFIAGLESSRSISRAEAVAALFPDLRSSAGSPQEALEALGDTLRVVPIEGIDEVDPNVLVRRLESGELLPRA